MESKEVNARLRPRFPFRKRLLQTAASLLGAALLFQMPPSEQALAENPPISSPASPKPDKETILNNLISPERLASEYNVRILNLPDVPKPVKLHFLSSAEEHPDFQALKGMKQNDNIPLYIVLLDGPYVDPQFLTRQQLESLPPEAALKLEAACEDTVNEAKEEYQRTKKAKILGYSDGLEILRKDLESGKISQDRYQAELQELDFDYLEPSREAILARGRSANLTPEIDRTENRYIFIAMRDVEDRVFRSGDEVITRPTSSDQHGYPRPHQSHPNPSRFDINPANRMYTVQSGLTPAFNLRHEIKHIIGVHHPDTDTKVVDDIKTATEETEQGNTKGWWVIWETEEGLTVSQAQNIPKAA